MDKKLKNLLIILAIIIALIIITPIILSKMSSRELDVFKDGYVMGAIKAVVALLFIYGVRTIWKKIKK